MQKSKWCFVALSLQAALSAVAAEPLDLPTLVERTRVAVVQIATFDSNNQPISNGTGFFIESDVIVTNWHVVDDASRVTIMFDDGSECEVAGVLAADATKDLALLKSRCPLVGEPLTLQTNLPSVGSAAIAIGNSLGLGIAVSEGIVGALPTDPRRTTIRITAPISPGNSGGPVLDDTGAVIGIATWSHARGQNVNFAVASSEVRELKRGTLKKFGKAVGATGAITSFQRREWLRPFVPPDGILETLSSYHQSLVVQRASDHVRLPGGVWLDLFRLRRERGDARMNVVERDGFGISSMDHRTIRNKPEYVEVVGGQFTGFIRLAGVPRQARHVVGMVVVKQALSDGVLVSIDENDNWAHIRSPIGQRVIEGAELFGDFWLRYSDEYQYVNQLGQTRKVPSFDLVYLHELRASPAQFAFGIKRGEVELRRPIVRHNMTQAERTVKKHGGHGFVVTTTEKYGPVKHEYEWRHPKITLYFRDQGKKAATKDSDDSASDHSEEITHVVRLRDGRELRGILIEESRSMIVLEVIVGSMRTTVELRRREIESISEVSEE